MRYRYVLILGLAATLIVVDATRHHAAAESAEEFESKYVMLWGSAINAKNKGKFDEAIALCTQALELIKDQPTLEKLDWMCLSTRAEAWAAKGEYGKALADYDQLLKTHQRAARAVGSREMAVFFARRGEARQKLGDLDGAIADFSEAMGLEPARRHVYLALRGDAWERKGEYEKADADYIELVQIHPDKSPTIKHLCLLQRARMWTKQGDADNAIQLCGEAIALKPEDYRALGLRAAAWQQKEEYDKAAADYSTAIRLDPNNDAYHAARADCYYELKQRGVQDGFDKAISDYSEALRLDPGNEHYYYKRGYLWNLTDRYDKAIADFSEAIRRSGRPEPYLFEQRAEAWRKKGDAQKAEADLAEAARLKKAADNAP